MNYSLEDDTKNYKTFDAKFENTEQFTNVVFESSEKELIATFQKNEVELDAQFGKNEQEKQIEMETNTEEFSEDLFSEETELEGEFGSYQEVHNGGITDHRFLNGRNLPDQHTIEAITGLEQRLSEIDQKIEELEENGEEPSEPGTSGENGATFFPFVSEDGDLSWTNDKGLENPETVNIKGPQGNPGKDGEDGKPGEDGLPGADGEDGVTPHIGDNGNWFIGENDTGSPSRGEPGKDGGDVDIDYSQIAFDTSEIVVKDPWEEEASKYLVETYHYDSFTWNSTSLCFEMTWTPPEGYTFRMGYANPWNGSAVCMVRNLNSKIMVYGIPNLPTYSTISSSYQFTCNLFLEKTDGLDTLRVCKRDSYVGMVIHSTTLDTMEKVIAIYGGTAWEKIEGRFLLGQSADYAIGTTGGEAEHTLTVDEMPEHRHNMEYSTDNNATFSKLSLGKDGATSSESYGALSNSVTLFANYSAQIATSGGSQPHNNMPPYKTVYIWERTA